MTHRWRILWLLALVELLVMTLWFSATAVVPQLAVEFGLDDGQKAWLTMSVQIGFVAGALVSAALNLADRFRAEHVIAASALLGAGFNAAIAVAEPTASAPTRIPMASPRSRSNHDAITFMPGG